MGAMLVSRGHYTAFQMAEVTLKRARFASILQLKVKLPLPPVMPTSIADSN